MSNDPSINSALWNFCMRANDGPRQERTEPLPPRDPADLEWLRQAMESVEMPEKTIKRILTSLHELDKGYAAPRGATAATAVSPASGPGNASAAPPPMLEAPPAAARTGPEEAPTPANVDPNENKRTAPWHPPAEQTAEAIDKLIEELEELNDLVEDLNYAKEFELMKGCEVVLYKLASPTPLGNAELRKQLLLVIAHASQNLEHLQDSFTKLKWAAQLVPMLRAESDAGCRAANILACSALCRGHPQASGEFVNAGGFAVLEGIIANHHDEDPKSVARALRLVQYFAENKVSSATMIDILCSVVTNEKNDVSAPAAASLAALVKEQPGLKGALALKLEGVIAKWKASEGIPEEKQALINQLA